VQVPAFAAFGDEAKARNIAIDKVARKALWWFRWSALSTFVTGILITIATKDYFSSFGDVSFGKQARGIAISTGMILGTIMLVNVWGVIWRNQKIVLANAANVLAGGEPDPNAVAAGRKAGMASRQNTIFSVSMLWFMVYTTHGPKAGDAVGTTSMILWWLLTLAIIVVLELNALQLMPWKGAANKGLNLLYDGPGVRNPLIAAFGLWAVFMVMTEILF
jgi:uncharacterized membrane protein